MCIDLSTLVVATRNNGKLREFRDLFCATGWRILGLPDLGIDRDHRETGSSFSENALQKALFYSMETEFPVLADDSGLEVSALGGRPGVLSARYAGPDAPDSEKIRKLLSELDASGGTREARFVCALALAGSGRLLLQAEGECLGMIAHHPRGSNGFGYDPVFRVPDLDKTFAELDAAEKNRYSHRARAVQALLEKCTGLTSA
jgi:XTP/dITP diphosphohydrolase